MGKIRKKKKSAKGHVSEEAVKMRIKREEIKQRRIKVKKRQEEEWKKWKKAKGAESEKKQRGKETSPTGQQSRATLHTITQLHTTELHTT